MPVTPRHAGRRVDLEAPAAHVVDLALPRRLDDLPSVLAPRRVLTIGPLL